jgi:hypothetical protein
MFGITDGKRSLAAADVRMREPLAGIEQRFGMSGNCGSASIG